MRFDVSLTLAALRDLEEIADHLSETEGPEKADKVVDRLLDASRTLVEFPERGSHPQELLDFGVRDFRQVICGRYRIVYRVHGQTVSILLIADGRRDMQTLLLRRLVS